MLIKILDLSLRFEKKEILKKINFEVSKPQIISVIGPNGSGKTSLLRCISKIYNNFNGTVKLNGDDIKSLKQSAIAKIIGMMHQEFFSIYDYKVEDIIKLGRYISDNASHQKFEEIVNYLNLEDKLELMLNEISTGEKQLVQIAMLMYQEPEIYIFDEPISHLDPYYQNLIIRTINDLYKKNHPVLVVFHNINKAIEISDRIIIIKKGELVFDDTPEKLLSNLSILDETFNSRSRLLKLENSDKQIILFD